MAKKKKSKPQRPPQKQKQEPGREYKMSPRPDSKPSTAKGAGKLEGKVALISGGDSGIGRAVAIAFAREGADVAILYLNEHKDAKETVRLVEKENRRCIAIAGDIGREKFCKGVVAQTIKKFGRLDILVNNAAEQHPQEGLEQISEKQLDRTFRTNIFAQFFLAKAALPHL